MNNGKITITSIIAILVIGVAWIWPVRSNNQAMEIWGNESLSLDQVESGNIDRNHFRSLAQLAVSGKDVAMKKGAIHILSMSLVRKMNIDGLSNEDVESLNQRRFKAQSTIIDDIKPIVIGSDFIITRSCRGKIEGEELYMEIGRLLEVMARYDHDVNKYVETVISGVDGSRESWRGAWREAVLRRSEAKSEVF